MIWLLVLSLVLLALVAGLAYLLGFRLGGAHWAAQVGQVRSEGARAAREMHELTRAAFVAMAEEAEKRRRS